MDISLIIICLSIALQLTSAYLAVSIMRLAGRRTPGLLALTVILLMALRRCVSLYHLITGQSPRVDLYAESIALSISFLLLIGIVYLSRLIQSERGMAAMLEDSRQHYQTLFNQSPDGVLLIDLNGHIIEFNETAAHDLGYTQEEFARLHLSDLDPVETPEEIKRRIADVLKKGKAEFDVKHRTKGGDIRDVHVITQTVESAGNQVFHTIWRDITEQKLAEKALKENESFLHTIIETEPECIKLLAADGALLLMNRAGLAMIDAESLAQVKGQCVYPLVAPEYREAFESLTEDVFKGKSGTLEFEAVGLRGRHIRLETHAVPLRNNKDEIIALLGVTRDVTERRRAEEELRESRNMLRQILDAMPQSVFWKNRESVYLGCNAVFARTMGLEDVEQIQGKTDFDLPWPKAEAEAYRTDDLEVITSHVAKRHIIEPLQQADGSRLWIDTSKVPLRDQKGNIYGVLGVFEDVTQQKQAEGVMRLQGEIARNISEGIYLVSAEDLRIVYANPKMEDMFGYGPGEMNGQHVSIINAPTGRDPAQTASRIEKALKETGIWRGEVLNRRKDGTTFYGLASISLLHHPEHGDVYVSLQTDITAQKMAEETLRQKEEMMRNLLDSVDEGFIVVDRDYRILTANRAYCAQVGMDPEAVQGKRCYEISHRVDRPCFENGEECATRLVFATGEHHVSVHRHMDQGNELIYIETKAFPLKDSSGEVTSVIEVLNNITGKQLLEEERLKTQKLEAVGTLAGGIAHDFNNLLQGVFGYISMAKMNLDQRQKSLDMLEQAEKALQLSVNLTTQLLTFSKGGKPVRKKIALRAAIENSVKFALSGSRIDAEIKVDEGLWMVEADEGQIGQVIQNIVLNAEQSMPVGGTVTIRAQNVRAPQKGLPPALPSGKYVEISVKDSGIGIPEEYLSKIFDPYFTTKDKGSGLGLATSYSIIKNHGGMLDVKSEMGKGSTFFVWLPAIEAVQQEAETASISGSAFGKFRILLMDDEELIRDIVGEMIRSLGHEVELAENGEEAIARYREELLSDRKFDIVILDLTVRGGMGGKAAVKELLQIDPDLKAVVSSGYADNSAISEYNALGFRTYLTKPYSVDVLSDVLNSLRN